MDGTAEINGNSTATLPPSEVMDDSDAGSFRRVILLASVLLVLAALAYFVPFRSWLRGSGQVSLALHAMGIWMYPACVAAVAILVACGVPRLLLCALSGMLLSFLPGLLVVQAGTLLGYYAVFLFSRWGGRDWALRRFPALKKWASLVHEHGTIGVILIRQLPVHGTIVNLALGVSHVRHRHFLIGTFFGALPEAIPATLAGAGLVKGSIKLTVGYLTIALVVLGVLWIGCGYLVKAARKTRAGSDLMVEAAILKGKA